MKTEGTAISAPSDAAVYENIAQARREADDSAHGEAGPQVVFQ